MLALLNKNRSAKKSDNVSPWRADFRDVQALPDTKTVRTNFLLNMVAFVILGGLILHYGQRELNLIGLKNEISLVEAQIRELSAPNTAAEAKFREFQAEEKKLNEVLALARKEFSFPDFINHLGSLFPSGVTVSRIEYRGFGQSIFVTGSIQGQDAEAMARASEFIKTLQNDAKFRETFASVTNSNLNRNFTQNSLDFDLQFTFRKK